MNLNADRAFVQSAVLVCMARLGCKISPSDVYLVENGYVKPFKLNNSQLATLGETTQGRYYINVRTDYLNQIYFGGVKY